MKAIYKCLHCDAAVQTDTTAPTDLTLPEALNVAFPEPGAGLHALTIQAAYRLTPYMPHPCESGILGVAMLVAVKE